MPSIEELFHDFTVVILVSENILIVSISFDTIVISLLKNRCNYPIETPLWFRFATNLNFSYKQAHITMNAPLNGVSLSITLGDKRITLRNKKFYDVSTHSKKKMIIQNV